MNSRMSLGVVEPRHGLFATLLLALGKQVVAVQSPHDDRLFLAILCADEDESVEDAADIVAALQRSDRRWRRQLRLGRWRGKHVVGDKLLLFWDGVEIAPVTLH